MLDRGCDRLAGPVVILNCEARTGASSPRSLPSGVLLERSSGRASYPQGGEALAHAFVRAGAVEVRSLPNL